MLSSVFVFLRSYSAYSAKGQRFWGTVCRGLFVALLAAGADSEAAKWAAGALANLTDGNCNTANKDAVREAGGILTVNTANHEAVREAGAIPPLVALLAAGADSDHAPRVHLGVRS